MVEYHKRLVILHRSSYLLGSLSGTLLAGIRVDSLIGTGIELVLAVESTPPSLEITSSEDSARRRVGKQSKSIEVLNCVIYDPDLIRI